MAAEGNTEAQSGFFGATYSLAIGAALAQIEWTQVESMVEELVSLRARGGRLFVLGLGGSAGNASHMVNDLRKLAGVEAYAPTDNISEYTARINDDGWGSAFKGWLKASRLGQDDGVFVLSVGGGDLARGVSVEIVEAVNHACTVGAAVFGIVGRDGGHTAAKGGNVVIVPNVDTTLTTPVAESFQAIIWHGLVSHPKLAISSAHWESLGCE